MDLIFLFFLTMMALLIMQLSFAGQMREKNKTIESQRFFVDSYAENILNLEDRVAYLEERLKYANSELTRLERLTNG